VPTTPPLAFRSVIPTPLMPGSPPSWRPLPLTSCQTRLPMLALQTGSWMTAITQTNESPPGKEEDSCTVVESRPAGTVMSKYLLNL